MSLKSIKSVLSVLVLASSMPFYAQAQAASSAAAFTPSAFLEQEGFRQWSDFLVQGRSEGAVLHESSYSSILGTLRPGRSQALLQRVSRGFSEARLQTSADYQLVAHHLLKIRQGVRELKGLRVEEKQKLLFVLQMMAEEALYVGSRKFADFPTSFSLEGDARATLPRVAKVREIPLQTGDVLLSKATGSGSSSLIALSMDVPHIFSHSTPAYVTPDGETLSPEAFIEDGVKLRDLQKDYASDAKTRLSVYRLKESHRDQLPAVEETMARFVDEMQARTQGKAREQAAYMYDFSMTPGEVEKRGLFCSSVACEIYKRAGVDPQLNPYRPEVWSSISGNRTYLLGILGVRNERVPAPGDVESNSNFELVGARINVSKLGQERVEMAIIDVIVDEVLKNGPTLKALSEKLQRLNEQPVDKAGIQKIIGSGLIPEEFTSMLKSMDSIPSNIKLSQLVIFGYMNEIMTPKLRQGLLEHIALAEKQGHIVTVAEIRAMVRTQVASAQAQLAELQRKVERSLMDPDGPSCSKVF